MFYKLIRDNIPALLAESGKKINSAVVEDEEFYAALLADKLKEELSEFNNAESNEDKLEELADLMTVIKAYAEVLGSTTTELDALYEEKLRVQGGFTKHVIGLFEENE